MPLYSAAMQNLADEMANLSANLEQLHGGNMTREESLLFKRELEYVNEMLDDSDEEEEDDGEDDPEAK